MRYGILLFLVLLPGCAFLDELLAGVLERPTLHFERAQVRDVTFQDLGLDLTWSVDNPNDFGLSLASIAYALDVDGHRLTEGRSDRGLKLEPRGRSEVTLPFDVQYRELAASLLALYQKAEVPYGVSGHFGFQTPAAVVEVPYAHQGTLPVPRLPRVQIAGARVRGLSLTGATLEVEVGLANDNRFPVPLDRLAYDLTVDGRRVAGGGAEVPDLPAGGASSVTLPVRLDFTSTGRAVYDAVRSGRVDLGLSGALDAGPVSVPVSLSRQVALR